MKKAIGQILSGNMLSKALGLLREILMAKFFGTGDINGAYRIAQTGTLVPINFMTSDSLNSAFIPLYKKYLAEDEQRAALFKFCMFLFFAIVSVLIFSILYFQSEYWVKLMAPGISESAREMSVSLLKVMAICCPFYLCSGLVNYISMAHGDYKPMSMRASVQNVGMVLGVVAAFYSGNYLYLAWGFTGSYVFFSFWVVFRAFKGEILNFPIKLETKEVKLVMSNFWITLRPLLILPLILQGNITLERALASLISIDVVSALDYARFITDTVVFILSVPIAFAGLSEWASQTPEQVREKIIKIYYWLALLVINMSFFLFLSARDIVIFLFMRGEFNEQSVLATTHIIQGMSIGLWAQVIGYIFIKALSAHLNNKKVLVVMVFSLLSNAVVNILTYKVWGAFGLGVGNAIYGIVMFMVSAWYLKIARSLYPVVIQVASGVAIYFCAYRFIGGYFNESASAMFRLLANGVVFFVFAFLWAMLFPFYRQGVIKLMTRKGLR
ncbi:murein biosynthesis integral membrane protein MurJ [Mangrovibacter yixingensis]|uniref:murein biosynthesis integral membrane protein MurJ n=1 Tax=Mangrovibacter yixingensis TaxID=1529639 RepID=UPI001CFB127F|nr:lipid II flippase MurJ [Mangrovibacter yixingensis]